MTTYYQTIFYFASLGSLFFYSNLSRRQFSPVETLLFKYFDILELDYDIRLNNTDR